MDVEGKERKARRRVESQKKKKEKDSKTSQDSYSHREGLLMTRCSRHEPLDVTDDGRIREVDPSNLHVEKEFPSLRMIRRLIRRSGDSVEEEVVDVDRWTERWEFVFGGGDIEGGFGEWFGGGGGGGRFDRFAVGDGIDLLKGLGSKKIRVDFHGSIDVGFLSWWWEAEGFEKRESHLRVDEDPSLHRRLVVNPQSFLLTRLRRWSSIGVENFEDELSPVTSEEFDVGFRLEQPGRREGRGAERLISFDAKMFV